MPTRATKSPFGGLVELIYPTKRIRIAATV